MKQQPFPGMEGFAVWAGRNLIAMECLPVRRDHDNSLALWGMQRIIRFVRQVAVVRLAIMTQVEN